jgi:hypothetical protein
MKNKSLPNEKTNKDELDLKSIIVSAIKEALPQEPKVTMTISECADYSGIGRDKLLELSHCQTIELRTKKYRNHVQ